MAMAAVMRARACVVVCVMMVLIAGAVVDGNCIAFDGSTRLTVTSSAAEAIEPGYKVFAVCAWIRTSSDGTIVFRGSSGGDFFALSVVGSKGNFAFSPGDDNVVTSGNTDVDDGEWHYLAGSRYDSRKGMIVTDGDDVETNYKSDSDRSIDLSQDMYIGYGETSSPFSLPGYFTGLIDELRFFGSPQSKLAVLHNWKLALQPSTLALQAYWRFNEMGGQTTYDCVGGIAATWSSSGAEWINDNAPLYGNLTGSNQGKSLYYSTSQGRVTACPVGALDSLTVATVEFVFRPHSTAYKKEYLFSYHTSAINVAAYYYEPSSDAGYIDIEAQKDGYNQICKRFKKGTRDRYQVNQLVWHHVALVFDFAGASVSAYLDGWSVDLDNTCGTSLGTAPYFGLGCRYATSTSDTLMGYLDEVRVWSVARTQQQIVSAMDVRLGHSHTNLVVYYSFDDINSELKTILDITGNNRDCFYGLGSSSVPSISSQSVLYTTRALNDSIPGPITPTEVAFRTSATFTLPGLLLDPLNAGLTVVAFAPRGQCNVPASRSGETTVPGPAVPATVTTAGIQEGGWHRACVSWDGGLTYAEQTDPSVFVVGTEPTGEYVTGVTPSIVGVGSHPNLTVTIGTDGVYATPTTRLAFAAAGQCGTARNGTTSITPGVYGVSASGGAYILPLGDAFTSAATSLGACYTVNNQDWVDQSGATLSVVGATPTTITGFAPTAIGQGAAITVTISGATATPTTLFALSVQCNGGTLYGTTAYTTQATEVPLGEAVTTANYYKLCYSVDGGTTWYEQVNVGIVHVVSPTAPVSLTPRQIAAGTRPAVTVSGPDGTSTSQFGFSADGTCGAGTVSGVTPYNASGTVTLGSALTNATHVHRMCMSTDSGATWSAVSDVTAAAVTMSVVSAEADAVSMLSPAVTWKNRQPTLNATGVRPSPTTAVAFVPASGGDCTVPGQRVGLTLFGLVGSWSTEPPSATTPVSATLGHAFASSGTYQMCYSTDGTTFYSQAGRTLSVFEDVTATTVTSFEPTSVGAGTTVNFTMAGSAAHNPPYSRVAWALPGTCELSAFRQNIATVPASWPSALTVPTAGNTYALCHSADGTVWVEQTSAGSLTVLAASSSSITSIFPAVFFTGSSGELFTVAGGTPTPTTSLAFINTTASYECLAWERIAQSPYTSGAQFLLASAITVPGSYRLCYTVDAVNWYLQVAPTFSVTDDAYVAKVRALNDVLEFKIGTTTIPTLVPTFAATNMTYPSYIGFALEGQDCASQVGITKFSSSASSVLGSDGGDPPCTDCGGAGGIVTAGRYRLCYTDGVLCTPNDKAEYRVQIGVRLTVIAAEATSVTAIDPTMIGVESTPRMLFTGAQATPTAAIAFAPSGQCDNATARVGFTLFNDTTYEGARIPLGTAIVTAGTLSVCYTTGSAWVEQSSVTLTTVKAEPDSVSVVTPSVVGQGSQTPLTITGPITSPDTRLALTRDVSGCVTRLGEVGYTETGPVLLPMRFTETGSYVVCYSLDAGATWVRQTLSGAVVTSVAVDATSVAVTSPAAAGAGTRPTVTLTGLPGTPTTYFALAPAGLCRDAAARTAATAYGSAVPTMVAAALPVNATALGSGRDRYVVCASVNGTELGESWVEQTGASINVVTATTTALTELLPAQIGRNSRPVMTFSGISVLTTTRVSFALDGKCSYAGLREGLTTVAASGPIELGTAIGAANTYAMCYSVDSGTTWVQQSGSGGVLVVVSAAATSVKTFDPSIIAVNTEPTIVFDAVAATPTTQIAFVLTSGTCGSAGSRVGVTNVTAMGGVTLSSGIGVSGEYRLCYTVNGGVAWEEQTAVAARLTVVASSGMSVTAFSPTVISTYSTPLMDLTGSAVGQAVVTTPTAEFAFAPHDQCSVDTSRNGTTGYPKAATTRLKASIDVAGAYVLCFTVDGNVWNEQTAAGYLNVTQGNPTSVGSVTPRVVGAGTRPVLNVLGPDGLALPGTPTTTLAFAPETVDCSDAGVTEGVTPYTTAGPVELASALTTGGRMRLCYSTDGLSYVGQTSPEALITVVTATNISAVSVTPGVIEKDTRGPLNMTGIAAAETTWVAFAFRGQCAGGRFAPTRVKTAGLVTLSRDISVAGEFVVCYSVNDGETWVEQERAGVGLIVQDCLSRATCDECTAVAHCGWCLDDNVCSVSLPCAGTRTTGTCPQLTTLTPRNSGSVRGGTVVTVEGSMFIDATATSGERLTCRFGSTSNYLAANATVLSSTALSCVSPPLPPAATVFADFVQVTLWMGIVQYSIGQVSYRYYDCAAVDVGGSSPTARCKDCHDATLRYECGWCASVSACTIRSDCSGLYGANGVCPAITTANPDQCEISGGCEVTVTGELFLNAPELMCVFGNVTAPTTYVSETELKCTAPPNEAGASTLFLSYSEEAYTDTVSFSFVASIVGPVVGSVSGFAAAVVAAALLLNQRRKKMMEHAPPPLTRAALHGILFKPPKVQKSNLGLAVHLIRLEEMLTDPKNLDLIFAIAKATQATEMDMAARSIVHLFFALSPRRVLDLIKAFITNEVAVSLSQQTLFRTNSFATKLFNVYSKMLGIPFLHEALGYVLNESLLAAGDIEVDSRRTESGTDDPLARFQLLLVNQKVLKSIVKAEPRVPAEFRDLFLHLQLTIRDKYPIRTNELAAVVHDGLMRDLDRTSEAFGMSADDHEELLQLKGSLGQDLTALQEQVEPVRVQFEKLNGHIHDLDLMLQAVVEAVDTLHGALDPTSVSAQRLMEEAKQQQNAIAIGGFFFLRFLVPAVTTPESYGILRDPPTQEQRRLLVLVAKVLQNLSNNVEFGRKEQYMVKLNDFLRSNRSTITQVFDKLVMMDRGEQVAQGGFCRTFLDKYFRLPGISAGRVTVPQTHHDAALVLLHRHIRTNVDKICDILEGENATRTTVELAAQLRALLKEVEAEAARYATSGRTARKGWLTKEGGRFKTWKERFFVLKESTLQYFKKEEDAKDHQPTGAIVLEQIVGGASGVRATTDVRDDDDEYTFAIETPDRTYNISAPSASDRDAWVGAIKEAINEMEANQARDAVRHVEARSRTATIGSRAAAIAALSAGDSDDEEESARGRTIVAFAEPIAVKPEAEGEDSGAGAGAVAEEGGDARVPPRLTKHMRSKTEVWLRFYDEDSGHYYFVSERSGESTWEAPQGVDVRSGEDQL